jgi:hypothetical protein
LAVAAIVRTVELDPGAFAPADPFAVARGAPQSPLRSGGRACGERRAYNLVRFAHQEGAGGTSTARRSVDGRSRNQTTPSGTSAAEGVAVDARGNVYGAEVGPKAVKKYVKK